MKQKKEKIKRSKKNKPVSVIYREEYITVEIEPIKWWQFWK